MSGRYGTSRWGTDDGSGAFADRQPGEVAADDPCPDGGGDAVDAVIGIVLVDAGISAVGAGFQRQRFRAGDDADILAAARVDGFFDVAFHAVGRPGGGQQQRMAGMAPPERGQKGLVGKQCRPGWVEEPAAAMAQMVGLSLIHI